MFAVKFSSILLAVLLLGTACTPAAQVAGQRATRQLTSDSQIFSSPLAFESTFEINEFIVENEKLAAEGDFTVVDFEGNNETIPVTLPVNGMNANQACTTLTVSMGPLDLQVLGLSLNAQTLQIVTTSNPEKGFTNEMLCGLVASFNNADMNLVAKLLNSVLALFG
jgi:hypothetical protein